MKSRERFWVEFNELFKHHGNTAARSGKEVSFGTTHIRRAYLKQDFHRLRTGKLVKIENGQEVSEQRFKLASPRNLKQKHIRALINDWLTREYSVPYLHNKLSVIRVFCGWIGKPNLVPSTAEVIMDPRYRHRSQVAVTDKTWSGCGIDVTQKILEIAGTDPRVAMVLDLMRVFSLRQREASLLCPHLSDQAAYLDINRGTKGGRSRTHKIDTPEERAVLESYVSAHPLETVAASLPAETLRRIGPLVVRGGEEEPGSAGMDPTVPSEALLRGVIVSVETRTDRNQETYARVRIEDFSGVAEVLVFATLYRETRDLWVGGRLVEARVEVQWDEGLSLVARRAKALEPGAREKKEEARRDPSRVGAGSAARRSERATGGGLSSGLHIRLDGNEERLEEIRDRLAASPGETPVYLHLREGENDRVFLLDAGADPDTMLVEVLGEILGANAVRMVS